MVAVVVLLQLDVCLVDGYSVPLGQLAYAFAEVFSDFICGYAADGAEVIVKLYILKIVEVAEDTELAEAGHSRKHSELNILVAVLEI